jgi:hypothetical protein
VGAGSHYPVGNTKNEPGVVCGSSALSTFGFVSSIRVFNMSLSFSTFFRPTSKILEAHRGAESLLDHQGLLGAFLSMICYQV